MKKVLALGGLLLAQMAMTGCMETASGGKSDAEGAKQSDLMRTRVEEAFPGQTGPEFQGYYRGNLITYQKINGKNVLDGDIVLDDGEITETPALQKESGAGINGYRWAGTTIPYNIAAGLPNTQRVTDAINHLSYKFKFVVRTNQADYITFRLGTDPNACYSNSIGKKGGQQFIDLSTNCSAGNTVHEIGHALGLFHEMTRQDRDTYVTINTANILPGYGGNFTKYTNGFDWQPFDFNSIMMYPAKAFGITVNGVVQTTIVAKDGRTWGNSIGVSEGDVSILEKMYPSAGFSWVSSSSLNSNRLDVFAARTNGAIVTAAWDQSIDAAGKFRGWWSIQNGYTAPGGAVDGISRGPLKFDVFTVGTGGQVYTAAWDHYVANGAWRGWWQIGNNITVYPGSHVVPVARTPNNLDVFAVGKNGNIYTAAWDQAVDGANGFRGWWPILGGVSLSGGQLSAITRGATALDVYAIGTDGNVYQASWSGGANWGGWWTLGNPGTLVNHVTAIARGQKIDLFAVGVNRNVYTRAWNGASWTNWTQIAGVASAGSRIAAVSRSSTRLDIFRIGSDRVVYVNGKTDGGAWSGWSSVLGGVAGSGAQVSAVARSSTKMDVFITGTDNRVWTAAYNGAWTGWWQLPQ